MEDIEAEIYIACEVMSKYFRSIFNAQGILRLQGFDCCALPVFDWIKNSSLVATDRDD